MSPSDVFRVAYRSLPSWAIFIHLPPPLSFSDPGAAASATDESKRAKRLRAHVIFRFLLSMGWATYYSGEPESPSFATTFRGRLLFLGREQLRKRAGRCLLRLLLAPAGAAGGEIGMDGDFYLEGLLVLRPGFRDHPVLGREAEAVLDVFLESRFVVRAAAAGGDAIERVGKVEIDYLEHFLPAVRQVDRADHRLERVGEHRALAAAAGELFPAAEQEQIPETNLPGDPGQPFLVDDQRAQLRQLPFGGAGETLHQSVADRQIHHRVPEKLEPLVVADAVSPMLVGVAFVSQGGQPERGVWKRDPKSGFQRSHLIFWLLLLQGRLLRELARDLIGELVGVGRALRNPTGDIVQATFFPLHLRQRRPQQSLAKQRDELHRGASALAALPPAGAVEEIAVRIHRGEKPGYAFVLR